MTKPESSLGIEGAASQSRGGIGACLLCGRQNRDPRPWDPRVSVCPDCEDRDFAPPAEPRADDGGEAVHSSLPPAEITQPSHDDEGLIERLRDRTIRKDDGDDGRGGWFSHLEPDPLTQEAANTISRLKGELDGQFSAGREYERDRSAVWIEERANDLLDKRLEAAESRSLLLEAEIEELRRGLEPFAKMARMLRFDPPQVLWEFDPPRLEYGFDHDGKIAFTYDAVTEDDLLQARALLSPRLVGVEDEVIPGSSEAKVSAPLPCRPEGQHSAGGEG